MRLTMYGIEDVPRGMEILGKIWRMHNTDNDMLTREREDIARRKAELDAEDAELAAEQTKRSR